jgi:hypothetical protein
VSAVQAVQPGSDDTGRNISMSLHIVPTAPNPQKTPAIPRLSTSPHNLAFPCIFLKIGSIFVAFITSPLTFNFPLINNFCAFASPLTNFPKSASLNDIVTADFLPSGAVPLPALPLSLRSMCQDSWAPEVFLRVKAKMAPPFLIASARSVGEEREVFMASKAMEEGKFAGGCVNRRLLGGWEGRELYGLRWTLCCSCGSFERSS